MGACVLAEDTDEHREIFGRDGEAVVYFSSTEQMIQRLRWLVAHDDERRRLGAAIRSRITKGRHTYRDRLESMVAVADGCSDVLTEDTAAPFPEPATDAVANGR